MQTTLDATHRTTVTTGVKGRSCNACFVTQAIITDQVFFILTHVPIVGLLQVTFMTFEEQP